MIALLRISLWIKVSGFWQSFLIIVAFFACGLGVPGSQAVLSIDFVKNTQWLQCSENKPLRNHVAAYVMCTSL